MQDENELKDYVSRCKDGGVKQALIIGGGREPESLSEAIKNGYDSIFGKQWPIWVGGILFGMINVFMFAFERPWSSANGIRNWGNWFFNSLEVTQVHLQFQGTDSLVLLLTI